MQEMGLLLRISVPVLQESVLSVRVLTEPVFSVQVLQESVSLPFLPQLPGALAEDVNFLFSLMTVSF